MTAARVQTLHRRASFRAAARGVMLSALASATRANSAPAFFSESGSCPRAQSEPGAKRVPMVSRAARRPSAWFHWPYESRTRAATASARGSVG